MVSDSTREYSVYLSNTDNTITGSGIIFYAGGDTLFVFTCAHVVDNLDKVKISFLKAKDAARDLYEVFTTEVPFSQIVFSPLDVVTEENGEKLHTEDIAIICIAKPADIEISVTEYYITEKYKTSSVYVQGYPNGVPSGEHPIEYLDCLHGYVSVNRVDSNQFTIRMDDPAIDSSNRVYELEGMSGAPIWSDDEGANALLGFLTCAYGSTAQLSKVRATKALQIRSIMKERFGVVIERKLDGVPEEDVAGSDFTTNTFCGEDIQESTNEYEEWIEERLSCLHYIIEDLKLQKAIDTSKELIANPKYKYLSNESQRKVKQYLLYCYEIADMDDEFDDLEADMRENGLIKDHDTLRLFTRTFMKRQFVETVESAQHYIDNWNDSERVGLLSLAKAFLALAKAYTENLPVQETIGSLLDEKENFIYPTDTIEENALIYQLIGYVYGEHYHDCVNSVRFLNRSYRVGFDGMVLESLAAAYYKLGVYDASDESGHIPDFRKIDRKALYKARECYLMIKEKADSLFWSGTMRRMGLCVYNTFVFLNDNYRILTIFPDVKKYLPNLNDAELRDIEMKYARISATKGEIDISEFPHITTDDGILLRAIAQSSKCAALIDQITANVPAEQIRNMDQFAEEIIWTIRYLEEVVQRINSRDRIPMYVQIINLYGRGMLMFGWNAKDKMTSLYNLISECEDPDLLESIDNFIFEMDAPIEESIKRFTATFERKKDIITWQELNHLYIRHGMLDRADEMYRELLSERKELIEEEPEYAYRAFIDYVMMYKRDLKYALRCYLDAKEAFQDTDIEGFWELELMICSNTFNNPDRFELERRPFVDQGLVTEESYHRAAFIAYLSNLNEAKAREHYYYIRRHMSSLNPMGGIIIPSKEEIHFLSWIGALKTNFSPSSNSMVEKRAAEVWDEYKHEMWHRIIDKQFVNQFRLNKTVAIDAWSLYQFAEKNMLDVLHTLDCIYVTHASVIRLLDELSVTNNIIIRAVLNYLVECDKICICSASFKPQLEVRNVTQYHESGSTVAIALEKDCVAIYGEPVVDKQLLEHFGNRIIRTNEMEHLIKVND